MKNAGIISIGNELLSGDAIDTNKAYLSRRLLSMGIPVVSGCTVGDDVEMISEAIGQALNHADIVLITGGLGPTEDDLTRQGLADLMGVALQYNDGLMRDIEDFFKKRDITMSSMNKAQAYLPDGAEALKNHIGTAPGILAEYQEKLIVALPGPPSEMKFMFEGLVAERLKELAGDYVVVRSKLRCYGAGESVIAEKLGEMMHRGRNPLVNCTVSGGIITLHIIATAENKNNAGEMVEDQAEKIIDILDDLVYGRNDETLAQVVGNELIRWKKTLSVAESCTGGLITKMLTDKPGSSEFFTHGWITYSNEAKMSELRIDRKLIEEHGAVSQEVASAMAESARKKAGTDYAVAVTGIAGPTGGSEQKPVGLVYIAVVSPRRQFVKRYVFSYTREHIRQRAALTALNMLRKELRI